MPIRSSVLNEGDVVGIGTHKELLQTCPAILRHCGVTIIRGGSWHNESNLFFKTVEVLTSNRTKYNLF